MNRKEVLGYKLRVYIDELDYLLEKTEYSYDDLILSFEKTSLISGLINDILEELQENGVPYEELGELIGE